MTFSRRLLFALALLAGTTAAEAASPLEGHVWHFAGASGAARQIPSLEFRQGRVSGSDGCNRFMGAYEASGEDGLSFDTSKMAGTRMVCPDMETPENFLRMLSEVRRFDVTNGRLRLRDDKGVVLSEFEPAD
jgi:heat shock protein HslJ